jgi:hypothetical protein
MTRSILVIGICAAALAGCGRTLVRETVVEKPVAAPATTIVERPVIQRPATIATVPANCSIGSAAYTSGTLSCQAGYQYVCRDGAWERIPGTSC